MKTILLLSIFDDMIFEILKTEEKLIIKHIIN